MLACSFGFCLWRLNLARGVLFLMSAEYSVVMCGTWPWTLVTLTVASSQHDMLLCSEKFRAQKSQTLRNLRYTSRVRVTDSRIRSPCPFLPWQDASGPRAGCIYVRYGYRAFLQPKFELVVAKCMFLLLVVWDRSIMCSVFTSTLNKMNRFLTV